MDIATIGGELSQRWILKSCRPVALGVSGHFPDRLRQDRFMESFCLGAGFEIFDHDGKSQMLTIILVNAACECRGAADVSRFSSNRAMVK